MTRTKRFCLPIKNFLLITVFALIPALANATNVLVETPLGDFEIELFDTQAPRTVFNFLNYVNDGDYTGSFMHRSVNNFVIQGGGFTFIDGELGNVPEDPPILNEFGLSNLRGTVAMAKLSGNPNSATSEWFINLADNSANLDTQNGGFTVFGRVVGSGMDVVDAIAALPTANAGQPALQDLPVIDFSGGQILAENLVFTDITVVPETPVSDFQINLGMAGSWFNPDTNGQGFVFDVVDNATTQFLGAAWFTFDINPPGMDDTDTFGSTQQRWFSANGDFTGNTATLQIFSPTNGVFNDGNFMVNRGEAIGTMIVRFFDCQNGEISFDFDSPDIADDTVEIRRIASSALCQAIVDGDLVLTQ